MSVRPRQARRPGATGRGRVLELVEQPPFLLEQEGPPVQRVRDARRLAGEPTASRPATGAGNRYNYWRIAVDTWRAHPIAGVGADGYEKPYFAQRTTAEDIRQSHSLPLQVLAELGIVGTVLFAAALVLIATGTWRRIRDGGRAPLVVAGPGVAATGSCTRAWTRCICCRR